MKIRHLLFLMCLAMNSCVIQYIPNVENVPLLGEKGELEVAAYTGTAGTDGQVSYALTDNLGIMANGSFANRSSDSGYVFHQHQFLEMGLGYYRTFNEYGRFEVFGGFGMGNVQGRYDDGTWTGSTDATFNRIFIQPTIGSTGEHFDGAFSSRFVLINMDEENEASTAFFVEPALTAKIGTKYVKAIIQTGLSIPINSNNLRFNNQPFMLAFGLQVNVHQFFKKTINSY